MSVLISSLSISKKPIHTISIWCEGQFQQSGNAEQSLTPTLFWTPDQKPAFMKCLGRNHSVAKLPDWIIRVTETCGQNKGVARPTRITTHAGHQERARSPVAPSNDYVTKAVYQSFFKKVPPVGTTKKVEKTTDVRDAINRLPQQRCQSVPKQSCQNVARTIFEEKCVNNE